ncbi:MAG: M64 family metallopeptidase [Bacteroidota bacterium]
MKHPISIFLSIILLSAFQPGKSQSFDQWFDEGVMRIDLVFSGTAIETSYAFSGVRRESFYSGSRSSLVDPFDYGDHKLQVKDAASGTLLYSHTYCTLFREWQTTSEADSLTRAFNHVIRFPWPKAKVVVEIYDRNEAGEFISHWSETVDPKSIFTDPGTRLKFETVDLEINGPPEGKVDLLFIAEGYTSDEMDKFVEDAKRSAGYIFSEEPFKSHRKAFNIRAVKSISKDSGSDIPGHGIWKNTVVNSNFYTFGIERYMTTLDYQSVCDVASNAHYDQVYILVNTDKYGGGGIYNFYSISAADNMDSRAVVIHEFGHSLGGLADEYYTSAVAYNDFFNLEVEPWNPNLTTLVDFGSKWKDLVSEDTPIPTPPVDDYKETVGVYEGGGYVSKGVFRPMIDCRMHSNDAVFCPVCNRALKQMIRRYSGL